MSGRGRQATRVWCPGNRTARPSHEEWRLAGRQPPSLALKGSPRGSRPAPEARGDSSRPKQPLEEPARRSAGDPSRLEQPVAKPPRRSTTDPSRLEQPATKPARRSTGDPSRLSRPPTGRTGAMRRSSLRFRRNTPGIPPSRALSAGRLAPTGRLAGLGAHADSPTGSSPLRSAFRISRNTLGIPPDSRLVSRASRPHRETGRSR